MLLPLSSEFAAKSSVKPDANIFAPLGGGISPLEFSRWMLFSMGVRMRLHHASRLSKSPFLMVSNHRSFLDAPLLEVATQRSVRFACHHYMAQVPIMK